MYYIEDFNTYNHIVTLPFTGYLRDLESIDFDAWIQGHSWLVWALAYISDF